ncbi:MAG: hypothetical protein OR994_06700 [Candidatus Poseidoniales archaeon]|nr:hypothetical protein [Candidatus Poseidoniales archaeon]
MSSDALDIPSCFVPVEKKGLFATFRTDRWWIQPLIMASILILFGIYTITVLLIEHGEIPYYAEYEDDFVYYNDDTSQNANGAHYVSPISSPGPNAIPSDILSWWPLPATLLFIWAPLGFRGTCYYGRRVFYRSLLANPAGCAVDKPVKSYNGENGLPFIIMNSHRYFLYLAIILAILHWYHAIESYVFGDSIGFGFGSFILTIDALFLTLYVSSCHSLRNLIGGNVDCISCTNYVKKKGNSWVNYLNQHHGLYFWISLVTIMIADFYVRIYLGLLGNEEIFQWVM